MKLSKRQKDALKKSIKKWEGIVSDELEDEGADNCELCKIYDHNDCKSCPVYLTSGHIYCKNTPYTTWSDYCYINNRTNWYGVFDTKSKQLAQAELDFLRGILDEAK